MGGRSVCASRRGAVQLISVCTSPRGGLKTEARRRMPSLVASEWSPIQQRSLDWVPVCVALQRQSSIPHRQLMRRAP